MITPPGLKKGDLVGLAAPAQKVRPDELEQAIELLHRWGLKVSFSTHLYSARHQYAGSDNQRASDLQEMLDDPRIKAILCVRGGYGCVRILPKLDFTRFQEKPKWLAGFSDISVFHLYINQVLGIETIHSTMPVSFTLNHKEDVSAESLRCALFARNIDLRFSSSPYSRIGKASGTLVGGNLSVICGLRGTFCDIDTRGKILFLEDIDEYHYHLDRMMMNLKLGGKLECLRGLIIGYMTDMKDYLGPFGKQAYAIIADAVKEYRFPVCFGFPAGHENPNMALRMGSTVHLQVGKRESVLRFEP